MTGPLVGGVFSDKLSWRWCFYINLPVGAVAFLALLLLFHDASSGQSKLKLAQWEKLRNLDIAGNMLLIGAAIMFLLSVESTGQGASWSSAPVIGMLVGSGTALVLFMLWQRHRQGSALIPPSVFQSRSVTASCATAFVVYGAISLHAYFLPLWFQIVMKDSALQSGIHMLPYFAISALFTVVAGAFVSVVGYYVPPALLGSALATIGSGLFVLLSPKTTILEWVGFEIVAAIGFGLVIQQGFTAVQATLPPDLSTIGTALVVSFQSLGGAIFISVGNGLFLSGLRLADASGIDGDIVLPDGEGPESMARLDAYNSALRTVFIACVPLTGLAFVFSCCLEWRSVKSKK